MVSGIRELLGLQEALLWTDEGMFGLLVSHPRLLKVQRTSAVVYGLEGT